MKVWDSESSKELHTLRGHNGGLRFVAVMPNGRYVVSGSQGNTLKLWDIMSGKELAIFYGEAGISSISLDPQGKTIVASDDNGTVYFLKLIERPPAS